MLSFQVRCEVISNIAFNATTIVKIIERLRDVEASVRNAAFLKCSNINPKYIRLVERQDIIVHGFQEQAPTVKKVFIDKLLPKWLEYYDTNMIKFLNALKLDADENDFSKSVNVFEDVLKVIFK